MFLRHGVDCVVVRWCQRPRLARGQGLQEAKAKACERPRLARGQGLREAKALVEIKVRQVEARSSVDSQAIGLQAAGSRSNS